MANNGKSDIVSVNSGGWRAGGVVRVWAACVLPAATSAFLNWPWWLGLALLVPGLCWYYAVEGVRYYEEMRSVYAHATVARRVPLLGMTPLIFVVVLVWPSRFSAILVVAGLISQDLLFYGRARARRSGRGLG